MNGGDNCFSWEGEEEKEKGRQRGKVVKINF